MCAARQQQLTKLAWLLIPFNLDVSFTGNPNVDVKKVDRPGVKVIIEGELGVGSCCNTP